MREMPCDSRSLVTQHDLDAERPPTLAVEIEPDKAKPFLLGHGRYAFQHLEIDGLAPMFLGELFEKRHSFRKVDSSIHLFNPPCNAPSNCVPSAPNLGPARRPLSRHPERPAGHVTRGGTFDMLYNPILSDRPLRRTS